MQKTNKKQIRITTKQKIGLIIFGIFLALIILELGLRVGGFVVSYGQRAGNRITGMATYENQKTYTILCLGESTTADLYGNQNSWPAQLEIVLNNKSSETKFKVFNEGVGGTNTAFILSRLEGNLNKYKPHIVITIMGINDEGLNIKYEETLRVKITLLFEDLRVYKLSKLLWTAWTNKIKNNATKDVINTAKELKLIEEEIEYIELGTIYNEQGKLKQAEEMFKRVIEINYNNYEAYTVLGWIYEQENRFKEAEEILRKAIELNPNDYEAYLGLGRVYHEEGKLKQAEEILNKAIELNPNNEEVYTRLTYVCYEQGISNKEIEEFYRKNGFLFKITEDITNDNIIKYHYQQLYKELNKRKIKYIAMQYPTLNIDGLKDMFEGNEDIIFVSNEENFKKALEESEYEDYFIDRFAGDFGHCTLKGNRLIAENVANAILEELEVN